MEPWPEEPPPADRVPSEADADALSGNVFRWVPGHWEPVKRVAPVYPPPSWAEPVEEITPQPLPDEPAV
jgi:hypothetical protein